MDMRYIWPEPSYILHHTLSIRGAKALARLRVCACVCEGSPETSLLADAIRTKILCACHYKPEGGLSYSVGELVYTVVYG